jgi:hypothetical protein
MLNFAETESNEAMAAAIGRRFLLLLEGAIVDFAERKNCSLGLSCGNSCISKAKVCEKLLSPEQLTLYKSLVKANKKGDAAAGEAIGKIRDEQQGKKEPKDVEDGGKKPSVDDSVLAKELAKVPEKDPYNPKLSEITGLVGRESSYAGVTQNTTNSRIFNARDSIDYLKKADADYQAGWLFDHANHMEVLDRSSKDYVDRANYEFTKIWDSAKPEAKQEIAKTFRNSKSVLIKALVARDVPDALPTPETKGAKPKAKQASKKSQKRDSLDDLLDSL